MVAMWSRILRTHTCVWYPYGPQRDSSQLNGFAVEEFEGGVAQVFVGEFLQDFARVWARHSQHPDTISHISDVHVIVVINCYSLNPSDEREENNFISFQKVQKQNKWLKK